AMLLAGRKEQLPFALNVNCPSCPMDKIKGVRVTRQGDSRIVDEFVRRENPRGTLYYWQAGMTKIMDEAEDTDAVCLKNRMISVTPIHYRLGAYPLQDGALREAELEKLLHGA
ncbi:MAG TPA: hypothetical protein PK600_09640, partial [Deltaproteobacteria bacterium]|nr:hypothetical protein [Deltaproteobacteria bacterium]